MGLNCGDMRVRYSLQNSRSSGLAPIRVEVKSYDSDWAVAAKEATNISSKQNFALNGAWHTNEHRLMYDIYGPAMQFYSYAASMF